MVASSLGIDAVAKLIFDQGTPPQLLEAACDSWTESQETGAELPSPPPFAAPWIWMTAALVTGRVSLLYALAAYYEPWQS